MKRVAYGEPFRLKKGTIKSLMVPFFAQDFQFVNPRGHPQAIIVKNDLLRVQIPGQGLRIDFVDDEPMIIKLGQRILERQGYNVETRASGTDALECFRQDPDRFDLVLTDMTMPGMRGD